MCASVNAATIASKASSLIIFLTPDALDSLKIESLEEFVKELRMLQRLGQHPNIINLVGACLLQGERRGRVA